VAVVMGWRALAQPQARCRGSGTAEPAPATFAITRIFRRSGDQHQQVLRLAESLRVIIPTI
jgi:hypothetical protein